MIMAILGMIGFGTVSVGMATLYLLGLHCNSLRYLAIGIVIILLGLVMLSYTINCTNTENRINFTNKYIQEDWGYRIRN